VRRARLLASTLVAASLALTACGGGDDESGDDTPAAQEIAGGSVLDSTWPLTGLPVEGDDTASQEHPVMVLKMDNTASSAPQLGLGEADLVVEELVEGGVTRLAAMYYSQIPGDVGPVRSMRASDIGIVKSTGATVVTSGAAGVTIGRINQAGIKFIQEGGPGFFRDTSRSAPYNLFTDMTETAEAAALDEPARPDDYLPWGDAADLPTGQPATTLAASFGSHTTNWTYDGTSYVNENTFADEGDEFPADTVLVLRVKVGDAGYTDPAGNPVPETKFEGTGEAMLFHGGNLVRGTWTKTGVDGAIELSTKAGELTVPVGHTWIELVPVDAANGGVTFAK
jgi:hypothetical protein